MCNVTKNFILNGTGCDCSKGYILNHQTFICEEICGDGNVISMACDDGNLINLDGCSNTCTVEKHFTCFNGSIDSPSVCLSALYNFEIELVKI
jgi:cysteine-rich repeat protein